MRMRSGFPIPVTAMESTRSRQAFSSLREECTPWPYPWSSGAVVIPG
jgi:hypothetical protein